MIKPDYKLIYGIIKGLEALEETHGIDLYANEIVEMTSILTPLISVDMPDSLSNWNDYFNMAFKKALNEDRYLKRDEIQTFIIHCFDIDVSIRLLEDL
jgi:hypothetical protein